MKSVCLFAAMLCLACMGSYVPDAVAAEPAKPLKALLITGGCCHDYSNQKKLLPEGISARINVDWTIVQQGGSSTTSKIPYYENDDWAKGFDIVVHNECFADAADPQWTARVLKPHRDGIPAVVIHCSMHCYRDKTDEWFKFLGVTSRGHGANYPFEVTNLAKDHPAMAKFGDSWQTPKGELYLIEKLWPTATPLAHAMSRDSKKNEVCIWTNDYNGTRVFGTTIGHHNEEISDPVFLDYVSRGILWACDKTNDQYLVPAKEPKFEFVPDPQAKTGKTGQPTPAKGVAKKVKVPVNLALKKTATASTSQDSDKSAAAGCDDDVSTRWCADGPVKNSWWQVDLEKPQDLTGCQIAWEFADGKYQYKIEGSSDCKEWKLLADQSKAKLVEETQQVPFTASGVRFVKITITELGPGQWPSFYELEVLGTELVEKTIYTGAGGANPAITKKLLAGVKAPAGFRTSLFAAPPDAGYPTCLACTPAGEVYIGVDENGSIDAKADRGRVVRAIDEDADGVADKFITFAKMDSPRGIFVDGKTVFVLHPPTLTAFHDDNGDGVSDRSDVLVEGIGFDLSKRGADHTTNGMRLGIDGCLYIAVGDYGFVKAVGKDGTTLQLQGGGVVRVRTDGSGLEIVSQGQRNIYDVAVDPHLNLFTRDNTNDGGGWNVRLSHVIPSGNYGYPRLFINFPQDIVQPLADYGGGSPCGSLFMDEAALPAPYATGLFTCDWGRSIVFQHPLKAKGAGFEAEQQTFLEIPRPTDMDVDSTGRIFVSSWRDGGFTYSGPNVGFVVCLTPDNWTAKPAIDFSAAKAEQLVALVGSASGVTRQAAQREILRRLGRPEVGLLVEQLQALALSNSPLAGRVAAIFTLRQLQGAGATAALVKMTAREDLREAALRALADDPRLARAVPAEPFVKGLADANPRVRLVAAWGLARLENSASSLHIPELIPLAADSDPLVAHVAVHSLVQLKAATASLAFLYTGDEAQFSALQKVLQEIHTAEVVEGLQKLVLAEKDSSRKLALATTLCRLAHQEAPWEGAWWGTRPDTRGPYYNLASWEKTEPIVAFLRELLAHSSNDEARQLLSQIKLHRVEMGDQTALLVKLAAETPTFQVTAAELLVSQKKLPLEAAKLLASVAVDETISLDLRTKALRAVQADTSNDSRRDLAIELTATILSAERPANDLLQPCLEFSRTSAITQQVEKWQKLVTAADSSPLQQEFAFVALLAIDGGAGGPNPVQRAAASQQLELAWQKASLLPPLLRAVGHTKAEKFALQTSLLAKDENAAIKSAAAYAAEQLALDSDVSGSKEPRVEIAKLAYEDVLTTALAEKGDVKLGQRLFARQGCISCHTVAAGETLKGPLLAGISARYKRPELTESVLRPSAKIAQGFETQLFITTDGLVLEGFVVREAGDEVEIRLANGTMRILAKSDIEERSKRPLSVMPLGLADKLTVKELASLLAYLESLPAKQ